MNRPRAGATSVRRPGVAAASTTSLSASFAEAPSSTPSRDTYARRIPRTSCSGRYSLCDCYRVHRFAVPCLLCFLGIVLFLIFYLFSILGKDPYEKSNLVGSKPKGVRDSCYTLGLHVLPPYCPKILVVNFTITLMDEVFVHFSNLVCHIHAATSKPT